MNNKATVSVCIITYNHQSYIKEAIEAVLKQKCNFNIEVIVSDDCSTDDTQHEIESIIREHQNASIIKYFRHTKNIGMMSNFLFALKECKGEYIALCDGDDYWIDENKLQKQVDFLNNNNDYVACFHNAKVLNNNTFKHYEKFRKPGKTPVKNIILKGGGIYPTASILFKNLIELPKLNFDVRAGDSLLIYSLIDEGEIYYSDEEMCVYRKHPEGVFTSLEQNKERILPDIISNIKLLKYFKVKSNNKEIFALAINNQIKRLSNRFGFFKVLKLTITNELGILSFVKFYLNRNKNK